MKSNDTENWVVINVTPGRTINAFFLEGVSTIEKYIYIYMYIEILSYMYS